MSLPVRSFSVALALLAPAGLAGAQRPAAGLLSGSDRAYLIKNAQGSVYDQSLAELGYQTATTPALRGYARQLIVDHDRLNLQALALAQRKGVVVPVTLQSSDAARLQRLSGLHGRAFNRAFLREEVRINSEDVSDAAKEVRTTRDREVRQFASTFHSTESRHLRNARFYLSRQAR